MLIGLLDCILTDDSEGLIVLDIVDFVTDVGSIMDGGAVVIINGCEVDLKNLMVFSS